MTKLFSPAKLGGLTLKNAIVMAPLTRSRAIQNLPNDLMKEYYTQRANAGLIITEGTAPSPNGLGYARIPGLFNLEQMRAWKSITNSVHAKGGKLFLQIMHTGRVSHPSNMPLGAEILAPSPIGLSGQMWTDQAGLQPYPTPRALSKEQIKQTEKEFVDCAALAMDAGFDGVELHAANGYLLEQFLNPASNRRTDEYGENPEGRMRFVLEVAKAVSEKIGAERVGMRLSPYGVFNDMQAFEGIDSFYSDLAKKLSDLKILYLHIVDHSSMGAPEVKPEVKALIRKNFRGSLILSGGYDAKRAESDLLEGRGDLIAFGRPFIANPDLVKKLENNLPLKEPDSNTFYTPGAKGYTDY